MKRRKNNAQPKGLVTSVTPEGGEMLLYDDIGPSWLGMVSAEDVATALNKFKGQARVNVRINSPGGDVFEGLAIYNLLARFPAEIVVDVDGLAASMASVIAMAGNRVRIAANGMMMIHRAWSIAMGNEADMRRVADLLVKIDDNLRDTYAARTKKNADEIKALMEAESWFTAEEAIAAGLADEIGQELNVSASVPRGRFKNTPEKLLAVDLEDDGDDDEESEEEAPSIDPGYALRAAEKKLQLQRQRFGV